jgi:hypothetical protein
MATPVELVERFYSLLRDGDVPSLVQGPMRER